MGSFQFLNHRVGFCDQGRIRLDIPRRVTIAAGPPACPNTRFLFQGATQQVCAAEVSDTVVGPKGEA